ncbi:unnamed protein product [Sphenostylis stenocarpa]|uniref:RBR-type E3 ubiquitin transferase n=1 Tax=Sphenostylis stenocarpa TaxID=92480 RepID=A0AA86SBE5_9FABA|nr:unnamed protein product [Sphenostylis stenocarpa]
MEGTSSASSSSTFPSTAEDHVLVDDLYFSALHDAEEIFPISDDKYAEELQLQEVLYSSTLSSARVENEVVQVDIDDDDDDDIPLRILKGKNKVTSESSHAYCGICMDAKPGEEMFRNQNCFHFFCDDCVGRYVAAKIQENITMVKCPEPKCKGVLEPQNCRSIIPKEVFDRWENALCENVVLGTQKFYCPFKDCSTMLIDDGDEIITVSECPHCSRLFCAQCKVSWHSGLDCSEFQSLKKDERGKEDLQVVELAKNKSWRRCPKCNFYVEKIDGCTHISCRANNGRTANTRRGKIEIKEVEQRNRQCVTFSKRKLGLCNKLTELSLLCNAETALIITSQNGNVYSCGYPNADAVLRRYITGGPPQLCSGANDKEKEEFLEKQRLEYESVQEKLKEKQKQLKETKETQKNSFCFPPWWNLPSEDMGLEDLEQFKTSLESLKFNLIEALQEKKLQKNLPSLPPIPYAMVPSPQFPNMSNLTQLCSGNQVENDGNSNVAKKTGTTKKFCAHCFGNTRPHVMVHNGWCVNGGRG